MVVIDFRNIRSQAPIGRMPIRKYRIEKGESGACYL
ncbi:hypothetical protein ABID30_003102 [Enterococcus rotai]